MLANRKDSVNKTVAMRNSQKSIRQKFGVRALWKFHFHSGWRTRTTTRKSTTGSCANAERRRSSISGVRIPRTDSTRNSTMRWAPPCAARIRRCCLSELTRKRDDTCTAVLRKGVRSGRETGGRRDIALDPTSGKIPRTTCGSSAWFQGEARSGSGCTESGRSSSACSAA